MESGIIVYKTVIPRTTLGETIERCLTLYEDNLIVELSSQDYDTRNLAQRSLELERMIQRHSDTFLPDRFKGRGYSRLKAVYAYPFEFPNNWHYPNRNSEGRTVMGMSVDGSSALVFPMSIMNKLYHYLWEEVLTMADIKEYWASAITLEDFVREFENPHKGEYIWISKDGRRQIDTPEVIIPEWALRSVSFVNAPKN